MSPLFPIPSIVVPLALSFLAGCTCGSGCEATPIPSVVIEIDGTSTSPDFSWIGDPATMMVIGPCVNQCAETDFLQPDGVWDPNMYPTPEMTEVTWALLADDFTVGFPTPVSYGVVPVGTAEEVGATEPAAHAFPPFTGLLPLEPGIRYGVYVETGSADGYVTGIGLETFTP